MLLHVLKWRERFALSASFTSGYPAGRAGNAYSVSFFAVTGSKSMTEAQVEVTDGWYSVRAVLDEMLTGMLQDGRLRVGMSSFF
jgi:hypothetical protein